MEIKASYFTALFALVYFGVGMFIIYFFRKRYSGRFGGQGYKFPAIIYFISIPIIKTYSLFQERSIWVVLEIAEMR